MYKHDTNIIIVRMHHHYDDVRLHSCLLNDRVLYEQYVYYVYDNLVYRLYKALVVAYE